MKRIIEGRRYNTETAKKIAGYDSRHSTSDFNWFSETLYRTPRGNWFLAGEGNANSRYAEPAGDLWGPGAGIKPLSADGARDWLERTGNVEALEAEFADQVEDA